MDKKQIPYGIADFKRIKTKNYYFVDKTQFIPAIESHDSYLVFLRPRRFGKSLWIAILEAYYDIYFKPEFETIFKDTWILNNRTPEASSYHILALDFSMIDTRKAEESFDFYIKISVEYFCKKYKIDIDFKSENSINMLNILLKYITDNNLKLYILIDEYDNFANHLFLENRTLYRDIVSDKNAFFKRFFTILKGGAQRNNAPVQRLFITGVTPMTLYDVTSGFNIGTNISVNPNFNEMTGVTAEELRQMYEYYEIDYSEDEHQLLSEWYNSYRFHRDAKQPVYNTDMILYYLKHVVFENRKPDDLIDMNVRSDYRKLQYLIYTDNKLNGNFSALQRIIAGETINVESISQDFSAFNLAEEKNFISLLFYLGLITIAEPDIDISLQIPNETIKRIDIDYLNASLTCENIFCLKTEELARQLKHFALSGSLEVFEYLASEIKRNTGIRDYMDRELCIKSMYLAYLSMTHYYVVKSEEELNKGFADIFVKPLSPYVKYIGLIEIKFFPRKDKKTKRVLKPAKKAVEQALKEAKEQLEKYQNDHIVTKYLKDGKILKKVALIFHGWELILCKEV